MADVPNTWPLNGYAPGNYACVCLTCRKGFVGDKRAITCLECAVKQVKAALSERERRTAQGVTVPDGWKLVPIEPTEEMIAAGLVARLNIQGGYYGGPSSWEAMLNAAPSLSTSAGGKERG